MELEPSKLVEGVELLDLINSMSSFPNDTKYLLILLRIWYFY